MSHLHIPDGVLPLWLIAVGWLGTAVLVGVSVWRAGRLDLRRQVPLVGAVAALMLVGMSSEIIPIAYHINLTVLAGILLGPWLSAITALVVMLMLSLVGHGGITVVGLNTLVIAAEMVLGWALFRALIQAFGRRRSAVVAGASTVIALALSTGLVVGIVALGGSPAASRESGALDPETLTFSNPFAEGLAGNSLFGDSHDHEGEEVHAEEDAHEGEDEHAEEGEHADEAAHEGEETFSVGRFAAVVFTLGSIGWLLEALITAMIVGFIARVRPGLVFEGAPAQEARKPVGDEGMNH